jgi:RNA polymerase sigma-70 factor (ECF subfamily)
VSVPGRPAHEERSAGSGGGATPEPAADRHADAALVERLRAGDEAAFADLVDRWSPSLLRVAVLQTRSHALAEEAVQDTWLAVLQGIDAFEFRASLRTWVFRILLYTSRSKAERERRVPSLTDAAGRSADGGQRGLPGEEPFLGTDHPHWPGHWSQPPRGWARVPDDAALGSELRRHIDDAIAALPPRQRAVLTLRDVEGLSPEEVCTALDLEPGNQRVLLHRARASVRAALVPYLAEDR